MKTQAWWLPPLLVGLCLIGVVAAVLYLVPGWHLLRVTQPHHAFNGDLITHYLGWAFYRNSEWGFPLGAIQDYFYPLGTNVGYTDSIPLLAILFKAFDAWLPTDFHYLGWWLAFCLWMQLWLSWVLLGRLGVSSPWLRWPATLLLGISPIWIFRTMHPALCAHFLLLGSIWAYHEQLRGHAWRSWWGQVTLSLVVAWVHPYLAVMVLAGIMAGLARQIHTVRGMRLKLAWGGLALVPPLLMLGSWWLIGYFELSQEQTVSSGLGRYATNLNAFFNAGENPGLLPSLPFAIGQYEGYAYLGLGLMLVGALWLPLRSWRGVQLQLQSEASWRARWGWLLAAGIGLFLFALSPRVHLGDHLLLSYLPTVKEIKFFHTFRSTGRFVWLPWYLLALGLLVAWSRLRIHPAVLAGVLWLAVGLQAKDLQPLMQRRHLPERPAPQEVLDLPTWENLFATADAVVAYPPFHIYYGMDERPPYLADLARRLQKPITMGYVARASRSQTDTYLVQLHDTLTTGNLSPNQLYIMLPEQAPDLQGAFHKQDVEVALFNGYLLLVHKQSSPGLLEAVKQVKADQPGKPRFESLAQFLQQYQATDHYVVMVVHDEGTYELGPFNRNYLKERGSSIESLLFRGSYWGIMRRGRVVAEMIENQDNLSLDLCPGDSLAGEPWQCDLHVESSGHGKGWRSGVWVNEKRLAGMRRGFNVAVFRADGELVDRGYFDTYSRPYEVVWQGDSIEP